MRPSLQCPIYEKSPQREEARFLPRPAGILGETGSKSMVNFKSPFRVADYQIVHAPSCFMWCESVVAGKSGCQ